MVLNLDSHFKPIHGEEINFDSFLFNGGEPHIRIAEFNTSEEVIVTHRINSFNDLGLLCIAVDALQRMKVEKIHLFIPYFPGARQDRVMVKGESLSVKVYADIINGLNIASVTIFDPHSDVTPALLNNCTTIQNHPFIGEILSDLSDELILVTPDAGASKKVFKLASQFGITNILECGKKRNVLTGELSGFTVPTDDLENKPCLVVDDICDGGGTFIGLAEELKKKNAGDLYLAVSHGIFSKGFDQLSKIYTQIFTTDSIKEIDNASIKQIRLNQILKLK